MRRVNEEEELADLEELWPGKPFELKHNIISFLVKRIVLDLMSPKFFRVLIEWKYKEWGSEQTYLTHSDGGRKEWTEEEIALMREIYPGQRGQLARSVLHRSSGRALSSCREVFALTYPSQLFRRDIF